MDNAEVYPNAQCALKNDLGRFEAGIIGRVVSGPGMLINVIWSGGAAPVPMRRCEIEILERLAVDGVYLD